MLQYREAIIATVSRNPVTVIQADTGAGKTTQVPLMLLAAGFGRKGMIGVTQPRRIAAVSVAEYVCQLHGTECGGIIGYQIKGERITSHATKLKFMTEGILLRELHADPELRRYEVIVVDEAHERGINQDLLIALLKRVRRARPDLKVIIMSATIDATKFSVHFDNAPVITIPGRLFPVEVRYASETPLGTREILKACAETITRIVRSGERGDILAFLPDEKSIHEVERTLERDKIAGIRILPLYGSQDVGAQRAVFARTPLRRVILATNIAETSITIDGVVHVVDAGLIKQEQYVNASMSALIVTEHSKAGCDQRKGRAGRTQSGICHRLYRRDDFDDRPDFTEPEIRRTALDQILLNLRVLGYTLDKVKGLEFMDPPGDDRWDEAEARLKALGAIDAKGAVTADGKRMHELPVAPMLGRMILEGEKRGCLTEIATIVAGFSARPVFLKAKDRDEQDAYDDVQQRFKDLSSDALTLLSVWRSWCAAGENGRRNDWAKQHRLSTRALREIERDRDHLIGVFETLGMELTSNEGPIEVRKAVAAGLMTNLCVAGGTHCYSWRDRGDIFIHPGSAVFGGRPRFMVCAEIVETTKAFARNCTAIEEAWIAELIPASALERKWRVEPNYSGGDAFMIEVVSWQGTPLSSRTITEFPSEAIPVVVQSVLSEIIAGFSDIKHPDSPSNRVVWHAIVDAIGLQLSWLPRVESLADCPSVVRMARFILERLAGARTIAEVRQRDLQLRLEDYLTPEQVAEHKERVVAEQVRVEAARVVREEMRQRELAEREAATRARAAAVAPLRERIEGIKQRLQGLGGDKVVRLRHLVECVAGRLDYGAWSVAELIREVDGFEAGVTTIEHEQHDKAELSEFAWQSVLETFPACLLCGGAWQVSGSTMLVCTALHESHRIIGRVGDTSRVGDVGCFRTDRDEDVARVSVGSIGVALIFTGARTHAWSGKKFKTVRFEPCAAILPPTLASEHAAIARDLEEYRRSRQELGAVHQRVREASAGGATVKPLTFRIKDGQAFAQNGIAQYRSAYQDPYPVDGETWFCRIGTDLGGRVIEVHPLFKASAISCEQDLEDLRALLRETYPGLPDSAFLP